MFETSVLEAVDASLVVHPFRAYFRQIFIVVVVGARKAVAEMHSRAVLLLIVVAAAVAAVACPQRVPSLSLGCP